MNTPEQQAAEEIWSEHDANHCIYTSPERMQEIIRDTATKPYRDALERINNASKYLLASTEPVTPIRLNESICVGCGQWTPRNNPEAHDHEDNCTEVRRVSAEHGQRALAFREGKRILNDAITAAETLLKGKP